MGAGTILLVEDDRDMLEMLSDALESLGCEVVAAAGGAEALERAAAHPDGVDVVVTDLVMPGMGGRELVERLRASRPDVRAICISGLSEQNVQREGLLPDGASFLHKPFTLDELFERLQRPRGEHERLRA